RCLRSFPTRRSSDLTVAVAAHDRDVVGQRLGLTGVVRVVGDDGRDVELPTDLDEALADLLLDGQAVVHQLEEVVVPAEDVLVSRSEEHTSELQSLTN